MMGDMTLWMLLGLLAVGAVIATAIYLGIRTGVGDAGKGSDALATLRRRLASGEITVAEYREREAAIRSSEGSAGTEHG